MICLVVGCGTVLSRYRSGEDVCALHHSSTSTLAEFFPAWTTEAACRGMDPDRFDKEPPSDMVETSTVLAAKRVCVSCPVTEECLAYAFGLESRVIAVDDSDLDVAGYREGIYGGLTGRERGKLASKPGRIQLGLQQLREQTDRFWLRPIQKEGADVA